MLKIYLYRNAYRANRIYYGDSYIMISGNNITFKAPKVLCNNTPTEYNELANKKYVDDTKIASIKLDRNNNKLVFINAVGNQIKVDATQLLYRADESTLSLDKETNTFKLSDLFIEENNSKFNEINAFKGQVSSMIPIQASAENKLADKDFVNSSIANSTATFRGTYTSIDSFPTEGIDGNDYLFLATTDALGNQKYDRYKYSNGAWIYEYTLNNSSFTEAQWKAINSGITNDYLSTLATKEYVNSIIQQSITSALEGDY